MAPRNLMLDFMQGYQFGDSINRANRAEDRQGRLDKQASDTLVRTEARQDKADARAEDTRNRANHLQDLQLEDYGKKQDATKAQEAEYHLSQLEKNPDYVVPEDTISWIKTKQPDLFKRPAKEQIDKIDGIMRTISSGGLPAKQEAVDFFNELYDSQIGEGKRIVDLYPGQNGGIIPELEVVGKDGKTYRAPMTVNRGTTEDGDNVVKEIPLQAIFQDVAMRRQVLGLLHGIQIRGGIDPQAAAKKLALTEAEEQVKAKYKEKKPIIVPRGATVLGEDNKPIYTAPAADGLTADKWGIARNDKLNAARVSAIGKLSETGAKHIEKAGANDPDGFLTELASGVLENKLVAIGNSETDPRAMSGTNLGADSYREAKKVLAESVKKAEAEAKAKEKARGYLEFDKTTFGGTREEWVGIRAREIALESMGGGTALPNTEQGQAPAGPAANGLGADYQAAVGKQFPQSKPESKKSILNSPSPSMDLGKALGGLTRGGVKAVTATSGAVPALGSFVDQATAKTLYAIAPENIVKELLNQSKSFATWWSNASSTQRSAFLAKTQAERSGQGKPANPADKYFK